MVNLPIEQVQEKMDICPECGAAIPRQFGYVAWCDQCNWNVRPESQNRPVSMFEALFLRLGKKVSQQLYESMQSVPVVRPGFSFSRMIAVTIAGLVYLVSVLFFTAGIIVLVKSGLHFFPILFSLLLFSLAWLGFPRFERQPKDVLPRQNFPVLYRLVDEISLQMGSREIQGIVLTPDFNASFVQAGIPGKNFIFLGLPLFYLLEEQEKVALLAHEIAHGVNGDPLRGYFTISAVNTLIRWSYVTRPASIWQPFGGILGVAASLLMVPINLVLFGLSQLLLGVAYGLMQLIFRDSQRAEYYADHIASTISGTGAMLSFLEKIYLRASAGIAVQHVALSTSRNNVFKAIQDQVSRLPAREIERLRRLNLLEDARIDATHPPTVYRVGLLQKRDRKDAKIRLSVDDAHKISMELQPVEAEIQEKLVGAYLSRI